MGTRADFYVGRGESMEWIGSIAWDGYPNGIDDQVLKAQSEEQFRMGLTEFFKGRADVTLPEMGWPWPWETSATTDFSYAFAEGKVLASGFGRPWFDPNIEGNGDEENEAENFKMNGSPKFPDMTALKNVARGERSGLLVFTKK